MQPTIIDKYYRHTNLMFICVYICITNILVIIITNCIYCKNTWIKTTYCHLHYANTISSYLRVKLKRHCKILEKIENLKFLIFDSNKSEHNNINCSKSQFSKSSKLFSCNMFCTLIDCKMHKTLVFGAFCFSINAGIYNIFLLLTVLANYGWSPK